MTAPAISVIIPHLNTPDSLRLCLASVVAQQLAADFEVIVVDNGSKLPIDALLAAEFPGVRLLVERTAGPGPARNTGAAAALAPLLAFIDADCIAAPGWLAQAHAAAAAGEIAGGRISVAVADARHMTGVEAFERVFGFRQQDYIERQHFSVTANLAMPRTRLDQVGPFGGIAIAEDLDWGRRAHGLGLKMVYRPDMLVFHPARPDFDALARKWDRLVSHRLQEHRASGAPAWRWIVLAAMVAASPLLDARQLLFSPLVSGLANRLRGIATLFRIRWYRARAMITAAALPAQSANWNR
jgi:glycosyltransferase involved in cell wall biosynthesis